MHRVVFQCRAEAHAWWQIICLGLFRNNEEVEIALRQHLRIQDPDFCHDGISNLVQIRDKCVNVIGDYAKNDDNE
jgi:hypothetical protein